MNIQINYMSLPEGLYLNYTFFNSGQKYKGDACMKIAINRQETITAFLCNMKFKTKLIGGVEEKDVLNQMAQVINLYQDWIEHLQSRNASLYQENVFLQRYLKEQQQEFQEKQIVSKQDF